MSFGELLRSTNGRGGVAIVKRNLDGQLMLANTVPLLDISIMLAKMIDS